MEVLHFDLLSILMFQKKKKKKKIGQIVLTGSMLQKARNKLAA
jgi:hypothetical protein